MTYPLTEKGVKGRIFASANVSQTAGAAIETAATMMRYRETRLKRETKTLNAAFFQGFSKKQPWLL